MSTTDRTPLATQPTDPRARAWVELRAGALVANLRTVREAVGSDVGVIPMAKADGYGLGMDGVVAALEPERPLAWGVATVEEGLRLRGLGVGRTILVCAPAPPDSVAAAVAGDLTLCLSSLAGLRRLEEEAVRAGRDAAFHVEIDTGMGRAGFDPDRLAEWGPALAATRGGRCVWTGCFTHLHSADSDAASIGTQWARFTAALDALEVPDGGFLVHAQNSAGALRAGRLGSGRWRVGAVRPGIFLYGGSAGEGTPAPQPVAAVRARVVHVREAAPGASLGYGSTHVAQGPERWATLAIGYGDGLPRALGNRGHALLGGRKVPIVGRVSMDMTVVNISDVPGVEAGDIATLIGQGAYERITVDEVAGLAGTISYEVLTGLTMRLPRIWMDDDGR